ncbi:MAG: serine/threonine-protein kinase [Kofleriaceae bacterium]
MTHAPAEADDDHWQVAASCYPTTAGRAGADGASSERDAMTAASRSSGSELAGRVIANRFEIVGKLGEGGMGAVYRAVQRSVNREVALKVMTPRYSRDAAAIARFQREAQLACQLAHPNIVTVFDHGQSETGQLFIAMELLRGRTLLQAVRNDGPLAIERIVAIGQQACDGLEAAHAIGIVHRDLKLDNVMLVEQPSGRELVKLLDFGLAKSDEALNVTALGMVVGTPRYVAPEHATTGYAEPASDIYALGVILGELAIGGPLWEGDDLGVLLRIKLQPSDVIAKLPPPLRRVIGAMLEPKPERRPTAADARALLQYLLEAPAITSALGRWVAPQRAASDPARQAVSSATTRRLRVPRHHARRWLALVGVAAGVFALALAALRMVRDDAHRVDAGIARRDDLASAVAAIGREPHGIELTSDALSSSVSQGSSVPQPPPSAPAGPHPPVSPALGPATLRVESRPDGAQIFVDGVDRGRGPSVVTGAIGDRHRIECRLRGYRSRMVAISISAPNTVVQCVLEPLANVQSPAAPTQTPRHDDDTQLVRPGD